MRSRLTLHHVEAFACVAELLSFRKAAQRLHMSQPALSRCIQGAEDALGTRLFDRDTRNVRLTPAGTEFLPIARRLLLEFHASLDEVSEYLGGDRGKLVIAALPSIGAALLPDVVCQFARLWPSVQVTIQAPHSQVVIDLVADGQADIGIALKPPKPDKVLYEHLLDDEFVLVCSPDHPLAGETSCSWQVFAEHPFIALSPTTSMWMLTQRMFRQLHMDVKPAYEMGGLPLTGKLIAAGLGITAIPRLVLPQMGQPDVRVIPLHAPVLQRSLGILTREGRTASVPANNFLKLLREAVSHSSQQASTE
nr:LysR family transcriptional regulator [Pseudomonas sp.]